MLNLVIQRTDIKKSINDSREYRGLELKNGLNVLLISDPDTDISAASLSVAVGSLNDPKDLPGLAHFCEHMLLMGSKKYPRENEFLQFVFQNGGYHNAQTKTDHTNYFCSSKTDVLRPLLERFSNMFFEPLFTESSAEKEINAIDSEHEKNKAYDTWRLLQLNKSLADPNHPFNHFGAGTKKTLWDIPKKNKINVCHRLLNFHSKWYSSHLMNLAVLGKEDLNTLEDMVVSLFKDIQKKDISLPSLIYPIYKEEQLATKTIVVPVKDIRKLIINFLLKDQQPYYNTMPIDYLNALFNDKSPTSLSSVLVNNGWSLYMNARNIYEARGIEIYEINIELTEFGLKHIDDIVSVIYQYVNMLKQNEPAEWFYTETKDIKAMKFHYQDKQSPLPYVRALTPRMMRYNLRDVLIAEHLFDDWKPELIKELLTYFTPDNMRMTVVSKKYRNQTNAIDQYYGTQYSVFKIPETTLNNWRNIGVVKYLEIPLKNEYIATNFTTVPIEHNEPDIPHIFHNDSIMRCWLKTDTVFRLPRAYISVELFSSIVSIDPFNCNIMDIFVRLFNDEYTQYTCAADRALLRTTMTSTTFGLNIVFYGFNHKMHCLMKKTFAKLFTFKIDSKRLEIIKKEKIQELEDIDMEPPFETAIRYSSLILSEVAWSPFELLRSIDNINAEDVRHFIDTFFSHMFIETLLYGNLDKRMAMTLIHELENACSIRGKFRPLLPREVIKSREVEMEDGESLLYEYVSGFNNSSCVYINLQCGMQGTRDNMVASLFNQIIREPCYKILRTQEQLGYLVLNHITKSNGVLNVVIIVQSDRHPKFVHTRIENFLSTIEGLLKDLSETDFNQNKESLSVQLKAKPKGMGEQSLAYMLEIVNQYYNFNRAKIEVEELKLITKKDIIDFYNEKISRTGSKRRKLAIHIKSSKIDMIDKLKSSRNSSEDKKSSAIMNVQKIKDISEFKKSHRLYPKPKSFIPFETNGIKYQEDQHVSFNEIDHLRRRSE